MTQSRADIKSFFNTTTDIKSFFKTDLKSEKHDTMSARHKVIFKDRPKVRTKMTYVDRHYVVLRTDIKSEKKKQRRLICQTDINSEKR
jgi:hypothetical protein